MGHKRSVHAATGNEIAEKEKTYQNDRKKQNKSALSHYLTWIMLTDTEGVKEALMKYTWNGLRLKPQYHIFGGDDVALALFIGSIISAVTATAASAGNTASQAVTNDKNQKNLETAWSRDDAQLQRARDDATKAGFSPLAALSSNLTNTAPSQMIAPQFDSSGLVSSIQSGTQHYASYKAQKPLMDQQVKAMKLENNFNSQTLFTRKLQNIANLAKSMKELDGLNLSNYEKASILVANGIPSKTVQRLIPNTTKDSVVENTGQKYLNNLQTAQAKLANAQADMSTKEKEFWFDKLSNDDAKIYVPVYDTEKEKFVIKGISSVGKSRKEMASTYERYMNNYLNSLSSYNANYQISDDKLFRELQEKNAGLMVELLKLAKP